MRVRNFVLSLLLLTISQLVQAEPGKIGTQGGEWPFPLQFEAVDLIDLQGSWSLSQDEMNLHIFAINESEHGQRIYFLLAVEDGPILAEGTGIFGKGYISGSVSYANGQSGRVRIGCGKKASGFKVFYYWEETTDGQPAKVSLLKKVKK